MRLTVANSAHVFDRDMVDRDPPDQCALICALNLTSPKLPRRFKNMNTSLVPHGRKRRETRLYKGEPLIAFASPYGLYDAP